MNERLLAFTRHAELMLDERGIDRTWVEHALKEPQAIEPDPARSDTFRAFRAIPERDGRVLRVVYTVSGEQIRVITAFFDRGRRRK